MHRAPYFCLLGLALMVFGALGCSKTAAPAPAGLMIIISTDMMPSEFDSIRVEVSQEENAGAGLWHKWLDETKSVPSEATLPTTVFIQSGSATDQDALIQVTALLLGQPVVLREAQLQIPTDRVAELRLVLAEACKGQVTITGSEGEPASTCPMTGQSCQLESNGTAMCGDTVVSSAGLPTYQPGDETLDAGQPPVGEAGEEPGDATADSATDATMATASGVDSGTEGGSVGLAPDGSACTNACTAGLTQCAVGVVQSCQTGANGCTQWVTTTTCGTHETCTVTGADAGATASCVCNSSECTEVGTVCQDSQTVATCAKDVSGCFYAASTSPCTAPMSCSGLTPSAACSLTCTNSCTQGQKSCVSGGLVTCTLGSNGCLAYSAPVACGAHQSCTGATGAATCSCNPNECVSANPVCAGSTAVATCGLDAQGCYYAVTSTACSASQTCGGGSCNCNPGLTNCGGACVSCAAGSLCAGQSCACASGAQCVPPVPNGWLGPIAADLAAQSACAASYPTIVPLGTNAQGSAASCDCQCTGCAGGGCAAYVDVYDGSDMTCVDGVQASFLVGTAVGDCAGSGLPDSQFASPRTVTNLTGATCGANTLSVNKPAASWGVPSRVCTGATIVPAACSGGDTCAPTVGSTENLCVYQSATAALTCPAGYPVASVRYSSWSDTRSCSCACNPSSASCTTNIEAVFGGCGATMGNYQITPCTPVGGGAPTPEIFALDLTVTGGTSYTPSGAVTNNASSTITVCCTN